MFRFNGDAMIEFGASALRSVGIAHADAVLTARSLVEADCRGTHSHGLLRLPLYVSAVERGGINTRPAIRWVSEQGATALLEADAALGQVAMQQATERVIDLAAAHGVAAVAVQGGSHYGAGSFWADQVVDAGMLAIVTSTTGPVVAPFGGGDKVFGTNPITLAAPGEAEDRLVADLATSTGAYGKVIAARNAGESIPAGWAVDPNGSPTTDPVAAMAGALTPFGGHKGSAISAAVEAFSAILGAGTFAFETEDIWSNPASRMNIGQLILAIDPSFFSGREHARNRTSELLGAIRRSAPGGDVLAPGDPERERARENGMTVPLSESVVDDLRELGKRLDIELPNPL
ncbi:Ldh family oxidoreductase [Leucobacter aridicollis]|nr:Ldh family oxidoreductase [Leucobacter aridicollis]